LTKEVVRDERGRLVKGSGSLNPGGRPKGISNLIRERYGDNLEDLLDMLDTMLKGVSSDKIKKEIITDFLDRVYGKPVVTQKIESDTIITVGKPKQDGDTYRPDSDT